MFRSNAVGYRLIIAFWLGLWSCRQGDGVSISEADLLRFDSLSYTGTVTPDSLFGIIEELELRSEGNDTLRADALRRKGLLYMQKGALEPALQSTQQSLLISENLKDTYAVSSTLINIGNIYSHFGFHDSALIPYSRGYHYYNGIGSPIGASLAAINLSMSFSELNRHPEAATAARNALYWKSRIPQVYQTYKSDSIIYLMRLCEALSKVHTDSGRAETKLLQQWCVRESNPGNRVWVSAFLAATLPPGNSWLKKASMEFHKGLPADIRKAVAHLLSTSWDKNGRPDSAYVFQKLFISLSDSFYNIEKVKAMSSATQAYRLLTNAEHARLRSTGSRQRWMIFGLVAVLAGLGTALYLAYRNYRQKRRLYLQELEIRNQTIDRMMQDQELNQVNAALEGQQTERQRIARELHDRLGSVLAVAKLNFHRMEEQLKALEDSNRKQYEQVSELLDEAVDEVRRISHDLYAGSVVKFGVVTALQQLAQAINSSGKCRVNLQLTGNLPELPDQTAIHVYRIFQELLSNSLKHADATDVHMQIISESGQLRLAFEDNGRGMSARADMISQGMGLKNISRRIEELKGSSHVETAPGRGYGFYVEIPLDHAG